MNPPASSEFIAIQGRYYEGDRSNVSRIASPGSQYIVQLLRGGYLGDYSEGKGRKALDTGCGAGFNLVSLAMMGWRAMGCELSTQIRDHALRNLQRFGCKADIRVGSNQAIPFPSSEFDLLLSINSVHYARSEEEMITAIGEFGRVLQPGGRLLMQTNHPDNWILRDGLCVSEHLVRLNCPQDFRNGQTFFVFRSGEEITGYLSNDFDGIQVGMIQTEFFVKRITNFIVAATRK